jgi:protein SCO1/2
LKPTALFVKTLALQAIVACLGLNMAHAADAPDPHAHHHAAMAQAKASTTTRQVEVRLPAIKLVRADGKTVDLATELADPRPLLLIFIFTTCSAICPVMSQVFSEVQGRLGADSGKLRMVSISIDPEHDTPARLDEYAKRFQAGPQWRFYTGTAGASIAAQKAFGAYRGDKMSHEPVTFLRQAPGLAWVRIDGLASPDDLTRQLQVVVAGK